jgi:ribosomal protein S18 acetylase RimI-like enzyme
VGACLCFQYPEEGWVRQLGVSPEWQGRGIGEALLRHAFLAFWRRGYTNVGLSVASDNPKARGFYERQGMRCLRQYVEYVRRGEAANPG